MKMVIVLFIKGKAGNRHEEIRLFSFTVKLNKLHNKLSIPRSESFVGFCVLSANNKVIGY